MIDSLLSSRLIFVTGKGGVGKSTACAGLGRALALRGKRVLIVETDTYSAMADLFNVPLTGSHPVRVDERLRVVNLLAQDALVEIIQQFVPGEKIARGIIGNRIASVFFNAAPSVNEFVILNRIFKYYQETEAGRPAYDHIVVDLPASGHAVTFLNAMVGERAPDAVFLDPMYPDVERKALQQRELRLGLTGRVARR